MNATYDTTDAWDQIGLVWLDDPAEPIIKIMVQDIFALKLDEKDPDQTAQLCMNMEQGLTTTSLVTTPAPTVAALTTQRGLLGPLLVALAAAESALEMKQDAIETWRVNTGALLVLSARNSQTAVGGDRTKMGELMIPLRALGQKTADNPPPILGLHVNDGDVSGESDWSWPSRKPGVPLYFFETAPAATGPWTLAKTTRKSRYTTQSTPGVEIWGRVTVELNDYRSDPSQPVSFRPH